MHWLVFSRRLMRQLSGRDHFGRERGVDPELEFNCRRKLWVLVRLEFDGFRSLSTADATAGL